MRTKSLQQVNYVLRACKLLCTVKFETISSANIKRSVLVIPAESRRAALLVPDLSVYLFESVPVKFRYHGARSMIHIK